MRKLTAAFLLIFLLGMGVLAQEELTVEEIGAYEVPLGRSPNIHDMEVGDDDLIYVLDQYQGVIVLNAEGEIQKTIFRNLIFDNPDEYLMDMALGADGTIWIASADNRTVYQLDGAGNQLREIGGFGDLSPRRIEVGPDGNIYVFETYVDELQRGRIRVFQPDATLLLSFDTQLEATEPYFAIFVDMRFGPDGKLYMTDYGPVGAGEIVSQMRVFEITEEGASIETPLFAEGNLPSGINMLAVSDEGQIAVVGNASDVTTHLLDSDGNLLAAFGEFTNPRAIEFLSDGSIVTVSSSISSITLTHYQVQ